MKVISTLWYIFTSLVLEVIILIKVITSVGDYGYGELWKLEAAEWKYEEDPETGEPLLVLSKPGENRWYKNLRNWIKEIWK